jgi:hypothetical protein
MFIKGVAITSSTIDSPPAPPFSPAVFGRTGDCAPNHLAARRADHPYLQKRRSTSAAAQRSVGVVFVWALHGRARWASRAPVSCVGSALHYRFYTLSLPRDASRCFAMFLIAANWPIFAVLLGRARAALFLNLAAV